MTEPGQFCLYILKSAVLLFITFFACISACHESDERKVYSEIEFYLAENIEPSIGELNDLADKVTDYTAFQKFIISQHKQGVDVFPWLLVLSARGIDSPVSLIEFITENRLDSPKIDRITAYIAAQNANPAQVKKLYEAISRAEEKDLQLNREMAYSLISSLFLHEMKKGTDQFLRVINESPEFKNKPIVIHDMIPMLSTTPHFEPFAYWLLSKQEDPSYSGCLPEVTSHYASAPAKAFEWLLSMKKDAVYIEAIRIFFRQLGKNYSRIGMHWFDHMDESRFEELWVTDQHHPELMSRETILELIFEAYFEGLATDPDHLNRIESDFPSLKNQTVIALFRKFFKNLKEPDKQTGSQ